jgi:hypothetical protein
MASDDFTGWRKSSYSSANGDCVEVTAGHAAVSVRDAKQQGRGPVLQFSAAAWASFIATCDFAI